MVKKSNKFLVIFSAALVAVFLMFGAVADSGQTIFIDSCGTLDQAGATYILTQDVSTTGDCFVVEADGVTLDGVGFSAMGDGGSVDYGFVAENHDSVTVKNLEVSNFARGIFFLHSGNSIITDNVATGNVVSGIRLSGSGSSGSLIEDNIVNDNGQFGLRLHSVSNNVVRSNDFNSNYQIGVYMSGVDSSNSVFENNVANSNGLYGISLISPSNNHMVKNNVVDGNGQYGIRLFAGPADYQISGNTVSNNVFGGIYLSSSSSNTVKDNVLTGNGDGIVLDGISDQNKLLNNQVVDSDTNAILDETGNDFINFLTYQNKNGVIEWTDDSPGGFLRDLTLEGDLTFPGNINIGNNLAEVLSSNFIGGISSSSHITLFSLPRFNNPTILKDGVKCNLECSNLIFVDRSTAEFDVVGWDSTVDDGATYSIIGNRAPSPSVEEGAFTYSSGALLN